MERAVFDLEDLVERFLEEGPGGEPVEGDLLAAVGNPEVVQAGALELAAHGRGDLPAALHVIDPEPADGFVGMAQGEAGCG